MKLIGLVRLGRDAELRYSGDGKTAILSFSGAYNYGRKGQDGKQPSQWVEFSLLGKRAENLAEHLKKGSQLFVVAGEVRVETYEKRDGSGQGMSFRATVEDLSFAGSKPEAQEAPRQAAKPSRPPARSTGFDDMDSDIPF